MTNQNSPLVALLADNTDLTARALDGAHELGELRVEVTTTVEPFTIYGSQMTILTATVAGSYCVEDYCGDGGCQAYGCDQFEPFNFKLETPVHGDDHPTGDDLVCYLLRDINADITNEENTYIIS